MNQRIREVVKFAVSGGVCFLIEYAALLLFKEVLHLGVVIATPLAFLISVAVNYLMCMRWVFDGTKNRSRTAQLGFALTSGMGLVLNWLLMLALTALFGEDTVVLSALGFHVKAYMINKVIATILVMVWNYFTKRWVLKAR